MEQQILMRVVVGIIFQMFFSVKSADQLICKYLDKAYDNGKQDRKIIY